MNTLQSLIIDIQGFFDSINPTITSGIVRNSLQIILNVNLLYDGTTPGLQSLLAQQGQHTHNT